MIKSTLQLNLQCLSKFGATLWQNRRHSSKIGTIVAVRWRCRSISARVHKILHEILYEILYKIL
ncbi:hypothetical protein [uncultured Campylobacter sp.]|uniref:hypothetical protein n=1 Tax=uncultured Campylobacter sp. TaxID=218934 RepID=UPI00261AA9C0|nr:hypothetical protein [uncultured Campylobacter sp.]